MKTIAKNRKARFNYSILEEWEAGIKLLGSEASVIRKKNFNISEAYVYEKNGELWLNNSWVEPYDNAFKGSNHDPKRDRKLLLNKKEISKITGNLVKKGYSIIPLEAYYNDRNIVKLKIGLGQGKKLHDKRETIKRRDADREIERALKEK